MTGCQGDAAATAKSETLGKPPWICAPQRLTDVVLSFREACYPWDADILVISKHLATD